MFIAKNNNLIIMAKNTKEELKSSLKFIVYDAIEETDTKYELYEGQYLSEEEIKEKKLEKFKKEFFGTSLGFVRRSVRMQNGDARDFLADILPLLKEGVPIITYNQDGGQNKNVQVTNEFIEECKNQLLQDFYGKGE